MFFAVGMEEINPVLLSLSRFASASCIAMSGALQLAPCVAWRLK